MDKTDKEVLELCKAWFEDIMERSDRLTSGNVSHGIASIRGVAKNYAEFVTEHLEERWKPSEKQMEALNEAIYHVDDVVATPLAKLIGDLKKLKE
jgi:hypothetical protein